jgi:cob(I)alamin adenosyltransferase
LTPEIEPLSGGMIIVYTGHGKGKTTAALGLIFRALGRGLEVAVVQYIKGKWMTGERLFAASLPGLSFHVMGLGFTWDSDDISRDKKAAIAAWELSRDLIMAGKHDLIVLDEITYVINYGFVPVEAVVDVLKQKPSHVNVVITGRSAPAELVDLAELVTEMAVVKHPYKAGRRAVKGIDF